MSNFRPIDRQTGFLLPPSVDEWLPEKHLARFVVEVIDGLDLSVMRGSYRGSGSASYPVLCSNRHQERLARNAQHEEHNLIFPKGYGLWPNHMLSRR